MWVLLLPELIVYCEGMDRFELNPNGSGVEVKSG